MDLILYRLLTQQMSALPDLSIVRQGQLLPEDWPVVLENIRSYRKQVQYFTVTDGTASVRCVSDVPNLYERIAGTELGTILHLLGAKTVFDDREKRYVLRIEDFMTLKQYDEHLQRIRAAEEKRQKELLQEDPFYSERSPG